MGFDAGAIDVRDSSVSLFMDGTSSIGNAILHANGARTGDVQIEGGVEASVGYLDEGPMLVNVRYEANPDPRPMLDSPALRVGPGPAPPSDGLLYTSARAIRARTDEGNARHREHFLVSGAADGCRK